MTPAEIPAFETDTVSNDIRMAGQKLARRTRAAQGLPRTIRERGAVRRVVALLCGRPESERADERKAS